MSTPIGALKYADLMITKAPTSSTNVGYFEGWLATHDIDRDGERFAVGAFTKSVADWVTSGRMPPVLWNHDRTNDPANVLGRVETMRTDKDGLYITARLLVGKSTRADAVYEALLAGALDTMSVAFIGFRWHVDAEGVKVWDEAEVLEATLTPTPANPRALVTAIKTNRGDAELERYRQRIDALARRSPTPREKTVDRMRNDLIADVRAERQEGERIMQLAAMNADRARRMSAGPTLQEELAEEEDRYRRDVGGLTERNGERAAEDARAAAAQAVKGKAEARRISSTNATVSAGPAPLIRPDMTPEDLATEEPTVLQAGRIPVWEVDDESEAFHVDLHHA